MEFSCAKITRNQAQAHGIVAEARARVGEVSRKDFVSKQISASTHNLSPSVALRCVKRLCTDLLHCSEATKHFGPHQFSCQQFVNKTGLCEAGFGL